MANGTNVDSTPTLDGKEPERTGEDDIDIDWVENYLEEYSTMRTVTYLMMMEKFVVRSYHCSWCVARMLTLAPATLCPKYIFNSIQKEKEQHNHAPVIARKRKAST